MLAGSSSDPAVRWMERIRLSGIVQGVGMRPWVFRLACDRGLSGSVHNDAAGVCIEVAGAREQVEDFVRALNSDPPPLARIDRIVRESCVNVASAGFHIVASGAGLARSGISPDAATCAHCLAEIRDPANRRYRYAFTNCTHCGPRFSILRAMPWDRCNTSMDAFTMCPDCQHEYDDPRDRRFHAQPNACPACGPRMWLENGMGRNTASLATGPDALAQVRRLLVDGRIVAIKGLGGFHLACDATSEAAVGRLRQRKQRDHKPFALMARHLDVIRRYCSPSLEEEALLRSAAAPIVLLAAGGPDRLAAAVAPGQSLYGFMLPYTPLHHLLLQDIDTPIVLTSGNLTDEPQCIENSLARERLGGIADVLLLHDRDIVNRVDDSVLRVMSGRPRWLRRARGAAPAALPLPPGFEAAPQVLALGGELKSTFCLLRSGEAILSQHLGDVDHASAWAALQDTLALVLRLLDQVPRVMAVDLHPDYLSSKLGRKRADSCGMALVAVQHHHAHIAACLADNLVALDAPPVLGVALDGLGYGSDGTMWGGEFLLADYHASRRLAAFRPVPMPGGVQAIREPWRMAYAYLTRCCNWDGLQRQHAGLDCIRALQARPLGVVDAMMRTGLNSPLTSSCGRLFDAVSALAGLRSVVSYEGQAAMELEACTDLQALQRGESYPLTITPFDAAGMTWIDTGSLWPALLQDAAQGLGTDRMSARFHNGLADAIAAMVQHLARHHGNLWRDRIALSGGVFQNAILLDAIVNRLQAKGLTIHSHAHVPSNDGGLSLGQALVAAARTMSS